MPASARPSSRATARSSSLATHSITSCRAARRSCSTPSWSTSAIRCRVRSSASSDVGDQAPALGGEQGDPLRLVAHRVLGATTAGDVEHGADQPRGATLRVPLELAAADHRPHLTPGPHDPVLDREAALAGDRPSPCASRAGPVAGVDALRGTPRTWPGSLAREPEDAVDLVRPDQPPRADGVDPAAEVGDALRLREVGAAPLGLLLAALALDRHRGDLGHRHDRGGVAVDAGRRPWRSESWMTPSASPSWPTSATVSRPRSGWCASTPEPPARQPGRSTRVAWRRAAETAVSCTRVSPGWCRSTAQRCAPASSRLWCATTAASCSSDRARLISTAAAASAPPGRSPGRDR